MDAFTVQMHVANYLNAASIPHLDHVYDAQPEAYGANLAAFGSGTTRCIGFVNCLDDTDVRESGPAADAAIQRKRAGVREMEFMIQLEVLHATSEDDWREAERQLKQDVIEGIRNAILNDPSVGTWNMPTPLFPSAGEGKRGIRRQYSLAEVDQEDGMRKQWGMLTFTVCLYESEA